MEQWIKRELWTICEIISLLAPRHKSNLTPRSTLLTPRESRTIHTNTRGRFFIKSSKKAIKSLFAHNTTGFGYEFSW